MGYGGWGFPVFSRPYRAGLTFWWQFVRASCRCRGGVRIDGRVVAPGSCMVGWCGVVPRLWANSFPFRGVRRLARVRPLVSVHRFGAVVCFGAPRCVVLCFAVLRRVVLCCAVVRPALSCRAVPCRAVVCLAVAWRAAPRCAAPRSVVLCCAVSRGALSWCAARRCADGRPQWDKLEGHVGPRVLRSSASLHQARRGARHRPRHGHSCHGNPSREWRRP